MGDTTVVRFRDPIPLHGIGAPHTWASRDTLTDLAGTEVRILLPPKRRSATWNNCDAEFIWLVPDDEVERISGHRPDQPRYVCEHQVDVD